MRVLKLKKKEGDHKIESGYKSVPVGQVIR